jgi:hypothetical protein
LAFVYRGFVGQPCTSDLRSAYRAIVPSERTSESMNMVLRLSSSLALGVSLLMPLATAHAERLALMCIWERGQSSHIGASLYSEHSLVFEIELDQKRFTVFSEMDRVALGAPTVVLSLADFRLEFRELAVTGLQEGSTLVVRVNRSNLSSTLSLEARVRVGSVSDHASPWVRVGNCRKWRDY